MHLFCRKLKVCTGTKEKWIVCTPLFGWPFNTDFMASVISIWSRTGTKETQMQFKWNSNCFLTRLDLHILHVQSITYHCLAAQTSACALISLEVQIQSFCFQRCLWYECVCVRTDEVPGLPKGTRIGSQVFYKRLRCGFRLVCIRISFEDNGVVIR